MSFRTCLPRSRRLYGDVESRLSKDGDWIPVYLAARRAFAGMTGGDIKYIFPVTPGNGYLHRFCRVSGNPVHRSGIFLTVLELPVSYVPD